MLNSNHYDACNLALSLLYGIRSEKFERDNDLGNALSDCHEAFRLVMNRRTGLHDDPDMQWAHYLLKRVDELELKSDAY